jgi:hypothetical protein
MRVPIIRPIIALAFLVLVGWMSASAKPSTPVRYIGTISRPLAAGDTIPAFPGCEGHGCMSLNTCRDSVTDGSWALEVWKVTSMATGAGTDGSLGAILQDSTSDTAYDIIVFDTSGVTPGNGFRPTLKRNCVYIAGQTAQGEGYMLYQDSANANAFGLGDSESNDPASDVVTRYLFFVKERCEGVAQDCPSSQDNISVTNGDRIVFDHISGIGGEDEVLGISCARGGSQSGLTVSNSLITMLFQGPLAMTIRSNIGSTVGSPCEKYDFFRVGFIHANHRIPQVTGGATSLLSDSIQDITIINSLYYDWESRGGVLNSMFANLTFARNFFMPHSDSDASELVRLQEPLRSNADTVGRN